MAYLKHYYERHRARLLAGLSARYRKDIEESRAKARAHYQQNRAAIRAKQHERYHLDIEVTRAKVRAYLKRNPHVPRSQSATRKARIKGVFVERVSLAYLYRRDKGICQLCFRRASVASASIDHIVPIAHGGEHSHRNTHLAHLKCNLAKGVRPGGQLRLIG